MTRSFHGLADRPKARQAPFSSDGTARTSRTSENRRRAIMGLHVCRVAALALLLASPVLALGEARAAVAAPGPVAPQAADSAPTYLVLDFGLTAEGKEWGHLCRMVPDLIRAALSDVVSAPSRVFRSRDMGLNYAGTKSPSCSTPDGTSAPLEVQAVEAFKRRHRADRWVIISGELYVIDEELFIEIDIEANGDHGDLAWSEKQYVSSKTFSGLVTTVPELAEDIRHVVEVPDARAKDRRFVIVAQCFRDLATDMFSPVPFLGPLVGIEFDLANPDHVASSELRSVMVHELKQYLLELFPDWDEPSTILLGENGDCDDQQVATELDESALTILLSGEFRRKDGRLHVVTFATLNKLDDRRHGPVFVFPKKGEADYIKTVRRVADQRVKFRTFASAALLADLDDSAAAVRQRVRSTWPESVQPRELLRLMQRVGQHFVAHDAKDADSIIELANAYLRAGYGRAVYSEIEQLIDDKSVAPSPRAWETYLRALNASGMYAEVLQFDHGEKELPAGVAGPWVDREVGVAALRQGDVTLATAKLESAFRATKGAAEAAYLLDVYAKRDQSQKIVATLEQLAAALKPTDPAEEHELAARLTPVHAKTMIGGRSDQEGNRAFEIYRRLKPDDTARVVEFGRLYLAMVVNHGRSWSLSKQTRTMDYATRYLVAAVQDMRECMLADPCDRQLGDMGLSVLPVLHLRLAEICLLTRVWDCAVFQAWLAEEGFAGRVAGQELYEEMSATPRETAKRICGGGVGGATEMTSHLQLSPTFREVSRYYKLLSCDMRQDSPARLERFAKKHGRQAIPTRTVYRTRDSQIVEMAWDFQALEELAVQIQSASKRKTEGQINSHLAGSIQTSLLAFNRQ